MLRIYFFIQNHLKANFLRFFYIKKTDWIPNRFLFAEKQGFELNHKTLIQLTFILDILT